MSGGTTISISGNSNDSNLVLGSSGASITKNVPLTLYQRILKGETITLDSGEVITKNFSIGSLTFDIKSRMRLILKLENGEIVGDHDHRAEYGGDINYYLPNTNQSVLAFNVKLSEGPDHLGVPINSPPLPQSNGPIVIPPPNMKKLNTLQRYAYIIPGIGVIVIKAGGYSYYLDLNLTNPIFTAYFNIGVPTDSELSLAGITRELNPFPGEYWIQGVVPHTLHEVTNETNHLH